MTTMGDWLAVLCPTTYDLAVIGVSGAVYKPSIELLRFRRSWRGIGDER